MFKTWSGNASEMLSAFALLWISTPGVVIKRRHTSSCRTMASKRRCRMTICSLSERTSLFDIKYQKPPLEVSFDQVIGTREQYARQCEAERLSGGDVNDQFKLHRLFDGHIGGLCSAEDFVDQLTSAAPDARPVRPIRPQAPRFDIQSVKVDRRQLCPQCQGIDLNSIRVVERFTRNDQGVRATRERFDSGRDILRTADFNYSDIQAELARRCLKRVRLRRRDGIADMVQHRQAPEIREQLAQQVD